MPEWAAHALHSDQQPGVADKKISNYSHWGRIMIEAPLPKKYAIHARCLRPLGTSYETLWIHYTGNWHSILPFKTCQLLCFEVSVNF